MGPRQLVHLRADRRLRPALPRPAGGLRGPDAVRAARRRRRHGRAARLRRRARRRGRVALLAIQASFEKHIATLRGLNYDILDVKATRWHDDYNTTFKNSLKDLEVMFQNVINTAFEGAATTDAGVELLDAFSSLAQREAIKRCVEKKSAEVFTNFTTELKPRQEGLRQAQGRPAR